MFLFLRKHWFLVGLLLVTLLGLVWPEPGRDGGWLMTRWTAPLAVAVIFFFNGMILPLATLRKDVGRWSLHLFSQSWLFVVSPLVMGLLIMLFASGLPWAWKTGLLFFAMLPCAVSTVVVYTQRADGNVTTALFNTVVANLLGVIWVPLVATLLMSTGGGVDWRAAAGMIGKVALVVLFPLLLGVIFQRLRPETSRRLALRAGCINSLLILYISYSGFSTVNLSDGSGLTPPLVFQVAVPLLVFVVGGFLLMARLVQLFPWRPVDRDAVFYCTTIKTLAAGLPMGAIIFPRDQWPAESWLFPLLIGYTLQLILGGLWAGRKDQSH